MILPWSASGRPTVEYDGANILVNFSLADIKSQSRNRVGMRSLRMAQMKLAQLVLDKKLPMSLDDLASAESSDGVLEDFVARLEKYSASKGNKGNHGSSFYPSAFYISVGGKVSKSFGPSVSGSINFGLVVMPTFTYVIPCDLIGINANEKLNKHQEANITSRVASIAVEALDGSPTASPAPVESSVGETNDQKLQKILAYIHAATKPTWVANFSFFFSPNVDAGIGLDSAVAPVNPGHRVMVGAIWGNMSSAKDFAGVSVGISGSAGIPFPIPVIGQVSAKLKTGGLHNFALPGFAQFFYFSIGYESGISGDVGIHINAIAPVFSGKRILGLLGIDESQYLNDEKMPDPMKSSMRSSMMSWILPAKTPMRNPIEASMKKNMELAQAFDLTGDLRGQELLDERFD